MLQAAQIHASKTILRKTFASPYFETDSCNICYSANNFLRKKRFELKISLQKKKWLQMKTRKQNLQKKCEQISFYKENKK